MPWARGISGNSAGRKPGKENIVSGKVRELWKNLLLENIDQLTKDFTALEPKDRLNIAVKISNFILPKLQAIETESYPDWSELLLLTPEERAKEMMKLKNKIENEKDR